MLSQKIQKWLDAKVFPQRVLLSGGGGIVDLAIEIARQLRETEREKIEKGIHTDVMVFRDTGKSFKIDWSDAAKKDEQGEYENVRGMIRWAYQKPIEGKYRIVILENFERISRDAPHALLKLIEEPPHYSIFLFTTKNHHQLLDTILSRMTIVRLPKESEENISPDAEGFFTETNLIKKFQKIEDLDKTARDNKDKKIDRKVFFEFLENLIEHTRKNQVHRKHMGLLFETHQAIGQNVNPRFSLERLAIKIAS